MSKDRTATMSNPYIESIELSNIPAPAYGDVVAVQPHPVNSPQGSRSHSQPDVGAEAVALIVWDISLVDKILYIITPTILIVCGVLTLLVMRTLELPKPSISCMYPAEFSPQIIRIAGTFCLSGHGKLYGPLTGNIPDYNVRPTLMDKVFPQKAYNPFTAAKLFLMALLCLVPVIFWRLFGSRDAGQHIAVGNQNSNQDFLSGMMNVLSIIVFLISKLAAVTVCGVMLFIFLSYVMPEVDAYVEKAANFQQPQDFRTLCDYRVQRLGHNTHLFTLECIISTGKDPTTLFLYVTRNFSHTLPPMMTALLYWLIGVLVAQAVNCLAVFAIFLISFSRSTRENTIERYAGRIHSTVLREKMNSGLGLTGCFVGMLAVRNGYSQGLTSLLNLLIGQL